MLVAAGVEAEMVDLKGGSFVMSRFKHSNVFKFIGACKDSIVVIATNILLGMSLWKYLLRIGPKHLDLRVAIGYALDISRATDCLHAKGVIHRKFET
ncbi:hypothetical protein MKX03_027862, partial [Papaver bracteatum]